MAFSGLAGSISITGLPSWCFSCTGGVGTACQPVGVAALRVPHHGQYSTASIFDGVPAADAASQAACRTSILWFQAAQHASGEISSRKRLDMGLSCRSILRTSLSAGCCSVNIMFHRHSVYSSEIRYLAIDNCCSVEHFCNSAARSSALRLAITARTLATHSAWGLSSVVPNS